MRWASRQCARSRSEGTCRNGCWMMLRLPPTSATTWEISLPVRFENTMTGRVVEYATPEEIAPPHRVWGSREEKAVAEHRSEEHTSELQSRENLVCRLLLEK